MTRQIDQEIIQATDELKKDVRITHDIVNGDANTEVDTGGGPVPTHAKVAKDSHDEIISLLKPTVSSINEHATFVSGKADEADSDADRAESAADRAEQITGLDTVLDVFRLAAVPLPDFHLPLNDNLLIREGKGTPVTIDVGGTEYPVPNMYQADFTRATSKTYISKSGELKTAQIDEPAFEQEGILIEGGSTNFALHSSDLLNPVHASPNGLFIKESDGMYKWSQQASVESDFYSFRVALSKAVAGTLSVLISPGSWKSFGVYIDGPVFGESAGTNFGVFDLDISESTPTYDGGSLPSYGKSSLTKIANDLYRLQLTISGEVDRFEIKMFPKNYTGGSSRIDSVDGQYIRIGFPQAEELPFASSHILTDGSPATRASDSLNLISSISHYVVGATISATVDSFGMVGNNRIWDMRKGSDYYWMLYNGTNLVGKALNKEISASIESNYFKSPKIITYSDSSGLYSDGIQLREGSNDALPNTNGLTSVIIGDDTGKGGRSIWGHIKNFRIWNHALTPEQIAALGGA